jgi:hypothetical protein
MPVFNFIDEVKNGINDVGYLNQKEHSLFFVSSSTERSFGNSTKDVLEVGIHNLQKEISSFVVITSSHENTPKIYPYEDVDGNTFNDVYSPSKNTSIQDGEKNLLLSIGDLIPAGSVTSNAVYLSVNPVSNLFSHNDPLTIKEISNSKKEIKLIRSFKAESVLNISNIEFSDEIGVTVNGKKDVKLKSGTVHTLKFSGDVKKLRFSKTRGGTFNGSVEYLNNIIYKPTVNEIILDTTEEFPKILYVYNADSAGSDALINLTEVIIKSDFRLNSEFFALGKDAFVFREIHDEVSYGVSSVNLTDVYNSTKTSFSENITALKNLLSFQSDNDVLKILSSIYYGDSLFDEDLGKYVKLLGVNNYIENHMKFNYEFVGNFVSLKNDVSRIAKSVCSSRILFYNQSATKLAGKKNDYSLSIIYLVSLIESTLNRVFSEIEFAYKNKYKSPLKCALNFGGGKLSPILISELRIDGEYWVKLKEPVSADITVGDKCSISNISIQPFFQIVTIGTKSSDKVIRLVSPNFSLSLNEPSNRTTSTKYYNTNQLSIERDSDNKIKVNKKLLDLNVDYTNFNKFVVFSSANIRIKIFKNKLRRITELNEEIAELMLFDSGSTSLTDRLSVYENLVNDKAEIDTIIGSFDGYEAYLHKSENVIYDTSLGIFVDSTGSSESSSFLSTLEDESVEYDKNNRDSLLNNSPEYIYENVDNDDYLKFLSMIGHHFDNIYLHISNIGIYKEIGRDIDSGMTGKMVSYVLNSFGFKIPPGMSGLIESSDTVENYLSSQEQTGIVNSISVDEKTKTIWKRMLLNLPSIYKSKGTEECIRQIFSIYGIPNNLIILKEFGGGYSNHEISSSYLSDEKEYLLEYLGEDGEYVEISGSNIPYKSVDFKLYIDPSNYTSSRLIVPLHEKFNTLDELIYSLGFLKVSDTLGRFYFTIRNESSTFTTLTDPVYLFSDEPMSVMLRKNYVDSKFDVAQSASWVPVKYDISIFRSSGGGKNVDSTTSFYLSGSLNDSFDDLSGSITFGNVGTANIISEISELIESQDSTFEFLREGSNAITSDSLPNYSMDRFRGCMDRFIIQSTPLIDSDFRLRGLNINSYYQGQPSSSYDDILFRFNLGIPEDFSSSSLSTEGHLVSNFNRIYSGSVALLYNFSGSNITSSLTTASCDTSSFSYFPHQRREFSVINEYTTQHIGPGRLENRKVNYISTEMLDSSLSPEKSLTHKNKSNQYSDSNRIGIFVSPIHERNKDILNFFGDYDIISAVSSPNDRFGKRYLKLEEFRRNYYKTNAVSKILFNELFSIYKIFIDKSIFETLKSVIPARNKTYSGILIEATLLERSRIEQKPADVFLSISLDGSIDMRDIPGTSNISAPMSSSIDLRYITDDNESYSESSFSGLSSFKDRTNEYETNAFLGENGYVEYDGRIYSAYKKRYTKSKSFSGGRVIRRHFYTMELILSGSSVQLPSNYTPLSSTAIFRPISKKRLPMRKTHGKSYQTKNTTISIAGEEDRSPVIRIITSQNLTNGNFGVSS